VIPQPLIIVMGESGCGPPRVSRHRLTSLPAAIATATRSEPHPRARRTGCPRAGCPGCELAGAPPNPPVLHVMGWGGGRRGCAGTRTGAATQVYARWQRRKLTPRGDRDGRDWDSAEWTLGSAPPPRTNDGGRSRSRKVAQTDDRLEWVGDRPTVHARERGEEVMNT
jgi:hypothetical protein